MRNGAQATDADREKHAMKTSPHPREKISASLNVPWRSACGGHLNLPDQAPARLRPGVGCPPTPNMNSHPEPMPFKPRGGFALFRPDRLP
jgi:hypothetical protein